jgi:ABC-type nitrate/sulfonate/bicarbonate transport system substrate-binding protein
MKCLLLGAWCALLLAAPAAAQSQIQPATVKVANSPNVLAWPVTTRIARIELAGQGVRVTFDKCASGPT